MVAMVLFGGHWFQGEPRPNEGAKGPSLSKPPDSDSLVWDVLMVTGWHPPCLAACVLRLYQCLTSTASWPSHWPRENCSSTRRSFGGWWSTQTMTPKGLGLNPGSVLASMWPQAVMWTPHAIISSSVQWSHSARCSVYCKVGSKLVISCCA